MEKTHSGTIQNAFCFENCEMWAVEGGKEMQGLRERSLRISGTRQLQSKTLQTNKQKKTLRFETTLC